MANQLDMASSSQPPKKYEVFISFRGEDTRFSFTNHLHSSLRRNHIDTYIDYRLEKGEEVWPALERVIERSTLFLVIFSENYASSTWCLRELTKILECSRNEGHHVMPVFYRVDPSHVRKQSESYQRAFEEHKQKGIDNQQLQNWRDALTYAANLSGWDSSNRYEARLIDEMVKCVIQKLGLENPNEDILEDKVGIHERMAVVESLLNNDSKNVQIIGIWGMGGVGKTTLATALFNNLHFAYEGSCFLKNVREKSGKYDTDALKEELFSKLLRDKETHAGRFLRRQTNFIVLDDVDNHEQLENLVGRRDWFGPGSKILITSRDKQVLVNKVDYIYQLKPLNFDEAFRFFCLNAFKNVYVGDPKMRKLAQIVTPYADGNPLALKVLGSFLHGKNQEEWKSQLDKLKKISHPEITDILKLSIKGLDAEEKKIFFYIACFFSFYYAFSNSYDVKDVINWLDACGYSTKIGLTRLEEKALLAIEGGEICMHHLIKKLGQEMIRGESLSDPKSKSLKILPHKLFDLRSLQSLCANGCNKVASNLHSILDEMRALSELELRDCSELFEVPDSIGMLSSLYWLDLSGSNIETLPSSIKRCSRLERLILDGCKRLHFLPQLPPSISILSADNCVSLETLHLSRIHNCSHWLNYDFSFKNCMKLDGQSIKAAEVNLLLKNNLQSSIVLKYPGEKVPEWFMYRSHQSPQTVDIPSIPQPWDGTFIFCAIISELRVVQRGRLFAECLIDGQHVRTYDRMGLSFKPLLSDHVILWSDEYPSGEVQRKIKEKKRESQDNTYHPLLQIRFSLLLYPESDVQIKECGAFPTSALQYQNYIQHLQLALQLRSHLENANIAALMSLENLIPSLKAIMNLKNLILSFKALVRLKNSRRSLKALRNLKNLILCLEALMNLKNLNMNLKNFTLLERSDKFKEFEESGSSD